MINFVILCCVILSTPIRITCRRNDATQHKHLTHVWNDQSVCCNNSAQMMKMTMMIMIMIMYINKWRAKRTSRVDYKYTTRIHLPTRRFETDNVTWEVETLKALRSVAAGYISLPFGMFANDTEWPAMPGTERPVNNAYARKRWQPESCPSFCMGLFFAIGLGKGLRPFRSS